LETLPEKKTTKRTTFGDAPQAVGGKKKTVHCCDHSVCSKE
jgi:hypothetical protein